MHFFFLISVIGIFITGPLFSASSLRMGSEVLNGHLIPSIMINGKTVIRIQDKGSKGRFESEFDRAENIYSTLLQLEKQGKSLGVIRVKRMQSEYVAYFKSEHIFTVSKGDALALNKTPYQTAKYWVENIRNAQVSSLTSTESVLPIEVERSSIKTFPLLSVFNHLFSPGAVTFVFQFVLFCSLQVGITYLVLTQYFRRHRDQTKKMLKKIICFEQEMIQLQRKLWVTEQALDLMKKED